MASYSLSINTLVWGDLRLSCLLNLAICSIVTHLPCTAVLTVCSVSLQNGLQLHAADLDAVRLGLALTSC